MPLLLSDNFANELIPPIRVMIDRSISLLWVGLVMSLCIVYHTWYNKENIEPFDLPSSLQALDSAPSTSELKTHYKNLLIYADSDIRATGTKALRLLADFRDRVYEHRNFRADLKVEDILANWPKWLPPLDKTMKEPVPLNEDAVNAELRMLAYLQKNFPQEAKIDQETGSVVRNLIEDFGYRFLVKKGVEGVKLKDDFLSVSLTKDWVNPTAGPPAPVKQTTALVK